MISAILRAQWLSMRLIAHRGAVFSLITGLIWYGFWCLLAAFVEELCCSALPAKK